jgi:tRNA isopentenyl-2-thiomethyl-A-37 hydroxylase MiaE
VIQLEKTAQKADYITEPDAILIDDSFCERKAATDRLGIHTFYASMLEMLRDSRQ